MQLQQDFQSPLATVFEALSDHDGMTRWMGKTIRRIRKGTLEANGAGSVRRIWLLPMVHFDEEVTHAALAEGHAHIDYRITRGMPWLEHHEGHIHLTEMAGGCHLVWDIQLDFRKGTLGGLLESTIHKGLQQDISKALQRLAKQLAA